MPKRLFLATKLIKRVGKYIYSSPLALDHSKNGKGSNRSVESWKIGSKWVYHHGNTRQHVLIPLKAVTNDWK